jgi:hypothetical protein
MLRRHTTGWLLASSMCRTFRGGATGGTPPPPSTEVALVEIWEHVKLGASPVSDLTAVRLMAPDATVHKLNGAAPMRYVMETFLVRADKGAARADCEEQGWWRARFTKSNGWNRRLLLQALIDDGYFISSSATSVADREWLLYSTTLQRDNTKR